MGRLIFSLYIGVFATLLLIATYCVGLLLMSAGLLKLVLWIPAYLIIALQFKGEKS